MNYKLKKIFTNFRVILLLIFLLLAVWAIHPVPNAEGAAIRTVLKNSTAADVGLVTPKPNLQPTAREVITSINNLPVKGEDDYYKIMEEIYASPPGTTVKIVTTKNELGYLLETQGIYNIIILNETEQKLVNITTEENQTQELVGLVVDNETKEEKNITTYKTVLVNKTVEKTITVNKTRQELVGIKDIGLKVYNAPTTNIRKGLDLEGGTRVLLEPETNISASDFDFLLSSMNERLNVYGLSDVVVRKASDLSGKSFIIVEIAGANEQEVKDLLAKQGKFEAKIENKTVFIGGKDITYVARSADQAGIDPSQGCKAYGTEGWMCRFRFGISITPDAAKKQAAATKALSVVKLDAQGQPVSKENQYLSGTIDFFLDDQPSDALNIGADLQGREVTEIMISGSGVGATEQEARFTALENMKRLQTILQTGSLPVKLNVVKTDAITPLLGKAFINNALFVGLIAILAVMLVIYITYRQWIITLPIVVTMVSEIIMILGFAAAFKWNLDLASIAGILISVGTGVDHLVIIADETLRKESALLINWKERVKNAFFIIIGAFATVVAAMIPLWWVGVGMLKGFAFTTIVGLMLGVFVARPVYAAVIEILLK